MDPFLRCMLAEKGSKRIVEEGYRFKPVGYEQQQEK